MSQGAEDPNPRSSKRLKLNEQKKTRHEYRGGLSVIRFLYHSSILIVPHRPLSEGAKNRVITILQGIKIRNTHGKRDKKLTFHGLTSDMTQEFHVFGEDGDEQFELEYEELPYLDLGMSPDGKPIYLPIEWCVIYSKDNKSNQRLRSLVSHETPRDLNYPENTNLVSETPREQPELNYKELLEKKWQLVLLGGNAPPETFAKFWQSIEIKCGNSSNENIIHISNTKELKETLKTVMEGTQILLCVMEKQDKPFERALKREAHLEKGILTQLCKLEDVEHYCDLYRKHNNYDDLDELAESWYVTNLAQEMIAKTGAYKDKALLPHSACPPRFKWRKPNCVVMYFGCKVINYSFTHLTVMVANISKSDHSTSDYVSRVALGDHMQNLQELFGELLKIYNENKHTDLPDRIIFFREGFVANGIEEMLRKEVDTLKEKLDSLRENVYSLREEPDSPKPAVTVYSPITFIVRDRKSDAHSVNAGDGKANYSIFSDENAICCSDFETLIRNLSYSKRYPKPLPVYYANRAARLAKVYLEGEMNPDQNKMDKIAKTIDRSLYVRGECQDAEQQDRAAEQEEAQQMDE
ncbi:hypothetical protein SUGI_0814210 [Cryptomeria japonica]|uniref:protein argonaute 7-like n=1 Tax=Cryptomeria japonica TaxID=3369 RepID=UPI0024146DA1|nr:protein argonaute 7-like [Cryptomeria japonica]GLJ39827.1 hypothetical protein SUGI_0814210 [Cryptomeria japonica]